MFSAHDTRSILHRLTLGLALLALPTAALAADGFARSSGTLRAGAGSDYPAIMRISSGTSLDVIGCVSRYSWCDVAVDGERGWFPGSRIGFLRDGRRVYLSDGGSALGLTILTFGMADYWGSHYSERPWYNERRWWRGHGPMPPRPPHRPGEVGGPEPAPPHAVPPGTNAGHPPLHTKPIGEVKPPVHKVEPPKVRTPRPIVKPIRKAPPGALRADPPRNLGGGTHVQAPPRQMKRPQAQPRQMQRPQMQQRQMQRPQAPQRQMRQGGGQRLLPPAGH